MKKILLFAILIVVTLLVLINHFILPKDKVINAVKDFEKGSSNISDDTVFEVKKSFCIIPLFNSISYDCDTVDRNYHWRVKKDCSEVVFYIKYKYSDDYNEVAKYNQDYCYKKALDYARSKYKNFDDLNMTLETIRFSGSSYEFVWVKYVGDILTNNKVDISVDTADGEVRSYISNRWYYKDIPKVNVDYNKLIDIVLNDLPKTRFNTFYSVPYLTYGAYNNLYGYDKHLYWNITVYVYNRAQSLTAYRYLVNANNGKIKRKKEYPLKERYNEYTTLDDYIKDRDNYKLLSVNDKTIKIKKGNKVYELNIGSEYVKYKNVKGKLVGKVKKENGVIYLPTSANLIFVYL